MVGCPQPKACGHCGGGKQSLILLLFCTMQVLNHMKSIIGKKVAMTQVFAKDGTVTPVTVVQAGPCVVTQIKTKATDGVDAVQLGYGFSKHLSKALQGHLKGIGSFRVLRQVRVSKEAGSGLERGATVDVSGFTEGDTVTVIGTSKGKGFQGVVKRHHFHGSPKTHGHKDQLRMPGSSGAGGLQHVAKGKRMPGRMGNARVTVKNLSVMKVDLEKNELWIQGAIPGARGSVVLLQGKS